MALLLLLLPFYQNCDSSMKVKSAVNLPSGEEDPVYNWREGNWSACSATACGTSGTQTRSVQCVEDDSVVVDDSLCAQPKPATSRSCSAPACGASYAWDIGAFGACSATACGTSGTQTRSVRCLQNGSTVVSDSNCPQPKPDTTQPCNAPACGGSTISTAMTVHNYASGTGPTDLVSNGIPFKSGDLTDVRNLRVLDGTTEIPVATKILARWPNNSIRVVLLQFSAPFSTTTKGYTLSIGTARTTTDLALTNVTFKYPRKIAVLTADYLSKSLVVWEQKPLATNGLTAWNNKQINNFSRINTEPNPATACSREDHYYDAINSSYQLYARTGELQYLTNGRRWGYHHGRDQVHLTGVNAGFPRCTGNYLTNTRYTFVDGLVRDYFFWGDEESLRVAKLVTDNFYVPHEARWYYKAPNTGGFWTEREAAFAQLGLVAMYEATGNNTYLNLAKDRFHSLYKMQQDNGNAAWVHNLYDHDPDEGCPQNSYGSSSFMSGLLAESLIRYHKLTKDPVARSSILYAADYLRLRNVATGSGAGNGFVYLGCSAYSDATPDIDLLIVHLYGYAYRLSNYTNNNYLQLGQNVFNYATSNGYAGGHKQFNQHFRSSGHFPAYIDPNVAGLD